MLVQSLAAPSMCRPMSTGSSSHSQPEPVSPSQESNSDTAFPGSPACRHLRVINAISLSLVSYGARLRSPALASALDAARLTSLCRDLCYSDNPHRRYPNDQLARNRISFAIGARQVAARLDRFVPSRKYDRAIPDGSPMVVLSGSALTRTATGRGRVAYLAPYWRR